MPLSAICQSATKEDIRIDLPTGRLIVEDLESYDILRVEHSILKLEKRDLMNIIAVGDSIRKADKNLYNLKEAQLKVQLSSKQSEIREMEDWGKKQRRDKRLLGIGTIGLIILWIIL